MRDVIEQIEWSKHYKFVDVLHDISLPELIIL